MVFHDGCDTRSFFRIFTNVRIIRSNSSPDGHDSVHFLQPMQYAPFCSSAPVFCSLNEIRNPDLPAFSRTVIADAAGLNSPVCVKEHSISHILHPVQDGISNIISRLRIPGLFRSTCHSDHLIFLIFSSQPLESSQFADLFQIISNLFQSQFEKSRLSGETCLPIPAMKVIILV